MRSRKASAAASSVGLVDGDPDAASVGVVGLDTEDDDDVGEDNGAAAGSLSSWQAVSERQATTVSGTRVRRRRPFGRRESTPDDNPPPVPSPIPLAPRSELPT
jgi:hypothetical protein